MCPITINKALLLQEGILKFELSWTAVKADVFYDYFTLIVPSVHVNDTGNTRLDTDDTQLDTATKLRFINGSDNL